MSASNMDTTCSDGTAFKWGTCGTNAKWTLDLDGVFTVFGSGAMTDYKETYINSGYYSSCPWESYKDRIQKIVIEEGITSIGNYSFYRFRNPTEVSIASSVTTIGSNAFWNCNGLTEITIPGSVKTIGNYAFRYCDKLKTVNLNSGLTTIGTYAFGGCAALTDITIPTTVTGIGSYAFSDSPRLSSPTGAV